MSRLKRWIKNSFYSTGNAKSLDRLVFLWSQLKYGTRNNLYKRANPGTPLPPPYFLYETYMPDYEKYMLDGKLAAEEILGWTENLINGPLKILEWGCGVGRIIRHIPDLAPGSPTIHACDINEHMILWDQQHLPDIIFETIRLQPPTIYKSSQFNLVFAISVLTHIEGLEQTAWFREIHRILEPGGIFLFTTHGKHYHHQLSESTITRLKKDGFYTRSYASKGHRMMTTYNEPTHIRALLVESFEVLDFRDGDEDPGMTGGQDLWIIKKK